MVNTKAWRTDFKPPTHALLMVHCFKCSKEFGIKWVHPFKRYSLKNNWSFWTGETEGDKKICDNCLIHFYRDDKPYFWSMVKETKKRDRISSYINQGSIRPS